MRQYESEAIPEYLSVRSIVAALTKHFHSSGTRVGDRDGESHDFPELFYVREGEFSMFVGGTVYPIRRGQMILYAPLNLHYGVGGDAQASIISFKADFGSLCGIYNRVISLNAELRLMLEAIVDEAEACYTKRDNLSTVGGMVKREGISEYRIQKLKRDLELFLIEVYRKEGLLETHEPHGKKERREEQFLAIVELLRERLGEPLTVEDIARGSSMSVSKLKMMFREYTGGGPIDYFINMKLDKAKELIRMGVYNLTEVAEALGFSSLHYFSRIFKARVGMSPSEWEKKDEREHAKEGTT